MSEHDIKTGWEPEARRLPPVLRPRQSNTTHVLLAILGGLQCVTLVFVLVWEMRYQRAMDLKDAVIESLETTGDLE